MPGARRNSLAGWSLPGRGGCLSVGVGGEVSLQLVPFGCDLVWLRLLVGTQHQTFGAVLEFPLDSADPGLARPREV